MNPKVSICIPTYKQANSLLILLNSIDCQSYRDFEVLVSDDSPNEEIEMLCQEFTKFPIRYFKNRTPKGSPDNWNEAISKANGEWIKLIHHDDYFQSKDALKLFVDYTEQFPDVDYFFSGTHIVDSNTGEEYPYIVNTTHLDLISKIPAFLFHKNLIGAPSTGFFKNSINLKYDKKLIWLVDIEYYIRLLDQCKVKYLPLNLVATVISNDQLTTQLKNNRDFEISEFLYCYEMHIKGFNSLNKRIMRTRLLDLLKEYNIQDINELKSLNLKSDIPFFVKLFLFINKINQSISYRFFYKMNNFSIG